MKFIYSLSLFLCNLVNVTNVVFTQKQTCPRLSWNATGYGFCDVKMFISFLQKDGTTINVIVPASAREYQDCRVTVKSIAVLYKAIVYAGVAEKMVQVGDDAMYRYTTLQKTEEIPCKSKYI